MSLQFAACKSVYKNLTLEEKTELFNDLSFEERQQLMLGFMKSSSTIGVCLPVLTEKFRTWITTVEVEPYFNVNHKYTEDEIMQAWHCWNYIFKYAKGSERYGADNLTILGGHWRKEGFFINSNPVTKQEYFEYLLDNTTPSKVGVNIHSSTDITHKSFNRVREWFSIYSLSLSGFG